MAFTHGDKKMHTTRNVDVSSPAYSSRTIHHRTFHHSLSSGKFVKTPVQLW